MRGLQNQFRWTEFMGHAEAKDISIYIMVFRQGSTSVRAAWGSKITRLILSRQRYHCVGLSDIYDLGFEHSDDIIFISK